MLKLANRYHLPLIAALAAVASTTIGSFASAQDPSVMPIPNGDEPPWVSIILAASWAVVEIFRKVESIKKLNNAALKADLDDLRENHEETKRSHEVQVQHLKSENEKRIDAIKEASDKTLDEVRDAHAKLEEDLKAEIDLMREEHYNLKLEARTAAIEAHAAKSGAVESLKQGRGE